MEQNHLKTIHNEKCEYFAKYSIFDKFPKNNAMN